ncbi:MAG TPA: hypothetical protein VFL85_04765 [Candidatus Saccharimonadales bacterium]|nr:hypothetical protein [Candidatus Saccharimonadales bacterium]
MSSPETGPKAPEGALASAEIFMNYEDHAFVRRETIGLARELYFRSLPNTFSMELGGIDLRGRVPLAYQSFIGTDHHRLSFQAERRPADQPHDAHVALTLHGNYPRSQIFINSDPLPVEYGQHKTFTVTRYQSEQAPVTLDCDDVCLLLDDYIPDAGRTFSSLADPRRDISFDQITLAMGDSLKAIAKTSTVTRSYNATESRLSTLDLSEQTAGSRLVITEKNGRTNYQLDITAPQQWDNGTVLETFRYSFGHTAWRGSNNDPRPLEAHAKIILASRQFSRNVLQSYLPASQENADGYALATRALQMVRDQHLPDRY